MSGTASVEVDLQLVVPLIFFKITETMLSRSSAKSVNVVVERVALLGAVLYGRFVVVNGLCRVEK